MRALNVFLSIAVSLLMLVLVAEAGLRLLGLGPPVTLNQPDPVLGWSKVPGRSIDNDKGEFDVEIALNELGLRDDPMPETTKPAGTFRVVALGDSFTLGWAVDREHLFVDELERWWRAEGRAVDVVNAGTEAYSTDQEVAWLEEHGGRFQPDLVLVFPYENDLYWNGQTSYANGMGKPRYEPDGTRSHAAIELPPEKPWTARVAVTRWLAPSQGVAADHLFQPPGAKGPILKEWGALLLKQPDFMADALAHTRGALLALRRECDALGATCVVVPIPSHSAVDTEYRAKFGSRHLAGLSDDAWSPDLPVDTFLRLAKEQGLATLDPRSTFKAATDNGAVLYNTVDWHLNPAGNRALAQFLHDELDTLGVFPESQQPTVTVEAGTALPEDVEGGVPTWAKVFGVLWVLLTALYIGHYRDEPVWQPPLKVAGMLAAVFALVLGLGQIMQSLSPEVAKLVGMAVVLGILGFVGYKLGRRLSTIAELIKSFVLRGHWYLLPLVVVLLTVGSLLVVAASSPLVAPFIYTLF